MRVAVLGDAMIDRYVSGTVSRLSPEAPVPVIEPTGVRDAPGGAANVALSVSRLGGEPRIVAAHGDDPDGAVLLDLLRGLDPAAESLPLQPRTVVKQRYVDQHGRHLLRVDHESRSVTRPDLIERALHSALRAPAAGLVVSDYGKGVVGPWLDDLLPAVSVPVVVNAKTGYHRFAGAAALLVLNRAELDAWCVEAGADGGIHARASALRAWANVDAVLVTLGSAGMVLASQHGPCLEIEARRCDVADATGAGDVVTATCGLCLAAGLPLETAVTLANVAAGASVARSGTGYATIDDIDPPRDGAAAPPVG